MNDRLLSLMGLCRRAGKMSLGCDPVREAIEEGKAHLVLAAGDLSANTLKKVTASAEEGKVNILTLKRSKEQMSLSLGKICGVVAINDEGFAKKFSELVLSECKEGGNNL